LDLQTSSLVEDLWEFSIDAEDGNNVERDNEMQKLEGNRQEDSKGGIKLVLFWLKWGDRRLGEREESVLLSGMSFGQISFERSEFLLVLYIPGPEGDRRIERGLENLAEAGVVGDLKTLFCEDSSDLGLLRPKEHDRLGGVSKHARFARWDPTEELEEGTDDAQGNATEDETDVEEEISKDSPTQPGNLSVATTSS
jgi:hypothetical protein